MTHERQHTCIDSGVFAATKLQSDCIDSGASAAILGQHVYNNMASAPASGFELDVDTKLSNTSVATEKLQHECIDSAPTSAYMLVLHGGDQHGGTLPSRRDLLHVEHDLHGGDQHDLHDGE
jgi:hypothetical protein